MRDSLLSKREIIGFYGFCFFIYCLMGWIYEVILGLCYGHGFVNRGFLFGPWLPVYGIGALLLILCLQPIFRKKRYLGKLPLTPFFIFIGTFVLTSVLEYITGAALMEFYQIRLWDYSADWLNINGYICPRTSFRFAIGGLLLFYVTQPLLRAWFVRWPVWLRKWLPLALTILFLLDLVVSLNLRY